MLPIAVTPITAPLEYLPLTLPLLIGGSFVYAAVKQGREYWRQGKRSPASYLWNVAWVALGLFVAYWLFGLLNGV